MASMVVCPVISQQWPDSPTGVGRGSQFSRDALYVVDDNDWHGALTRFQLAGAEKSIRRVLRRNNAIRLAEVRYRYLLISGTVTPG